MHDTALESGKAFFEAYTRPKHTHVLDVGSMDVNGSLRGFAPADLTYIGLDVEPGPGVDIVIAPNSTFPVTDDSFDLVVSSSCFEHDDMFWVTFLEMCRAVRDGGYIYLSAPSNGTYHRFPQDNWRFYPDSGEALARWARRNGYVIALQESGTLRRRDDMWNDFVAVFQKGRHRAQGKVPSDGLLARFPNAMNVRYGSNDEAHAFSLKSEDMLILDSSLEAANLLRAQVAQLEQDLTQARQSLTELQAGGNSPNVQVSVVPDPEREAMVRAIAMLSDSLTDMRERAQKAEGYRTEMDDVVRTNALLTQEIEETRQHFRGLESTKDILTKERDELLQAVNRLATAETPLRDNILELEARAAELDVTQRAERDALIEAHDQLHSVAHATAIERDGLKLSLQSTAEERDSLKVMLQSTAAERDEKALIAVLNKEDLRKARADAERVKTELSQEIGHLRTQAANMAEDQVRSAAREVDLLAEAKNQESNLTAARTEIGQLTQQLKELMDKLAAMESSAVWRLTKPLRR